MSVAFITGAGGALGRAIAIRLAADGHAVAICDITPGPLARTAELVGPNVLPLVCDVRDEASVTAAFVAAAAELGPVGIAVNNAAIYPTTPFLDIGVSEYDNVQAVNQRGYWLVAQAAARQMVPTGSGSIVNIASITSHGGWADLASYVTTKGAAITMTRALARELGPFGIRVNAVSPGAFPTAAEEIYSDPAAYNAQVLGQQSLKRRGTPAELASVVSFLTGPDSSFVTGQTIEVNGGWVMT